MSSESKNVYAPAAEVVGMALQYMTEKETSDNDKKWRDIYMKNIFKMLSSLQAGRNDQLIVVVHKMSQHYPPVIDE